MADLAAPMAPHQTLHLRPPPEPLDPALVELYIWDPWPVLHADGTVADVHGQEWWIVLTADRDMHAEERHDHARLRLLRRSREGWQDLGVLFPDQASPGSREWSGTAVFDAEASQLRVLYTATGLRGEVAPSFQQQVFEAYADVREGRIVSWGAHTEVITSAPPYLPADECDSGRAFRDPFYFCDPRDGLEYLLFAASLPDGEQEHGGAIGIAGYQHGAWVLQTPLIDAVGVNRELERPHLLYQDGTYYLFFSTHGRSFHRHLPGRTGLYGFCSPNIRGPYTPLNGSGLVLGNPDDTPHAQYAWQVLSHGSVIGFTNYPDCGPGPLSDDAAFAGTIAPFVQLKLRGAESRIQSHVSVGATA